MPSSEGFRGGPECSSQAGGWAVQEAFCDPEGAPWPEGYLKCL